MLLAWCWLLVLVAGAGCWLLVACCLVLVAWCWLLGAGCWCWLLGAGCWFFDFRYSFLARQFSPYIYADGGLLLMVSDLNATKLFINPGLGARYSLGRRFAANGSVGILTQVDGVNRASFGVVKLGGVFVF